MKAVAKAGSFPNKRLEDTNLLSQLALSEVDFSEDSLSEDEVSGDDIDNVNLCTIDKGALLEHAGFKRGRLCNGEVASCDEGDCSTQSASKRQRLS